MCKMCGKPDHDFWTEEEREKIAASRTPLWTAFFLAKAKTARTAARPDDPIRPAVRFTKDKNWKGENDE